MSHEPGTIRTDRVPCSPPMREGPGVGLHTPSARHRGMAYLAAVGVAMLVAVIAVGALLASRIAGRSVETTNDMIEARFLAQSAVELTLHHVAENPDTWRADLDGGTVLNDRPLGSGTMSVQASDPADGDLLDSVADDVLIVGIGEAGVARVKLERRLNGQGVAVIGSWRQTTD